MNGRVGWIAAGVATVAVVGVVSVVLVRRSADEPPAEPAPCRLARPRGTVQADPSGVTVAEQGSSVLPGTTPRLSVGVVLQNTTDRVAYRTRVAFDAGGKRSVVILPLLLPGQKASLGTTLVSTRESATVTPTVSEWLPSGNDRNGLAPVDVRVIPDSVRPGETLAATFFFSTTTGNCAGLVYRGIGLVWRDQAGRIVGGDLNEEAQPGACSALGSGRPLPSRTRERFLPPGAVLEKLEGTVFCDLLRTPPS